jgi:hypothetical protein
MDRYATRLVRYMAGHTDDIEITVATKIAQLTVDDGGGRKGRQESGPRPISLEPSVSQVPVPYHSSPV